MNKKTLFRLALTAEGISGAVFAQRLGVSEAAIWRVVAGQSSSQRLTEAIDELIGRRVEVMEERPGFARVRLTVQTTKAA